MSSLIPLALYTDFKTMKSSAENPIDLFETDQFATGFVDSFAAVDGGKSEAMSSGILDLEGDVPKSLNHGLAIPVVAAETPDEPVVSPVQETENGFHEWNQPLKEMGGEVQHSEDLETPSTILQHHKLNFSADTKVARGDEPKIAPLASDTVTSFDASEQPKVLPERALPKENAAQHFENIEPKNERIFLDADLVKYGEKQSSAKTGLAEDSAASSSRLAIPVSSNPAMATPAITMTAPIAAATAPVVTPAVPISALTFPVLNMESDGQWIARLSQDIGRISADKSALSFQLKPHHLGRLHVEVSAQGAGEIVRLETDNENAKALIIGSQGRLEQDVRMSGLKLARLDVTVHEQTGSSPGQQETDAQQSGSGWAGNPAARAEGYSAEHILSPATDIEATASHQGARYA